MKLKIHRGAGQIGGNIVEIASEKTKIILDCGKNLPPLDGSDLRDDIEIDGLTRGESAYDAVFVTHYHADHCGLIERINPDVPIFAGRETKAVLEVIADFIDAPTPRVNQILEHGRAVPVGDLEILPLRVGHSAEGAFLFLVRGDGGGKLLYTGDFNRIDDAYYPLIGEIDALLCEGTNIGARGGPTEEDVEREAARIMRETCGPVFVLCSATNIDRIKSVENACRASVRTIAIDPFLKAVTDRAARQLPLINPVGFIPHYIEKEKQPRVHKYVGEDLQSFSSAEALSKMRNLTFMVRQSMGEFIVRLNSKGTSLEDSILLYSMWRGYEESGATKRFLDLCRSRGIRVEYLHASGHAYRDTIETLVLHLRPKTLIPIHTESAGSFREIHERVVPLGDGEMFDCTQ